MQKVVLVATVVTMVGFNFNTALAQKQTTEKPAEKPANSLAVAVAVAENPIVGYRFHIYSNSSTIESSMTLAGWITSLSIDDRVIFEEGEAILPGIPLPQSGYLSDVRFYVEGIGKNGEFIGRAYRHIKVLSSGDTVNMVLSMDYIRKVVRITGSWSDGDTIQIDGNTQNVGRYSSRESGFVLYVIPRMSVSEHTYRIVSSEGEILASGVLNPYYGPIDSGDQGTFVSVKIEGNVISIPSAWYINQDFTWDEGSYLYNDHGPSDPAVVFVLDATYGANMTFRGDFASEVEAFELIDGELILVNWTDDGDNGGYMYVMPTSNPIIVTAVGDVGDTFEANINTGGGKG